MIYLLYYEFKAPMKAPTTHFHESKGVREIKSILNTSMTWPLPHSPWLWTKHFCSVPACPCVATEKTVGRLHESGEWAGRKSSRNCLMELRMVINSKHWKWPFSAHHPPLSSLSLCRTSRLSMHRINQRSYELQVWDIIVLSAKQSYLRHYSVSCFRTVSGQTACGKPGWTTECLGLFVCLLLGIKSLGFFPGPVSSLTSQLQEVVCFVVSAEVQCPFSWPSMSSYQVLCTMLTRVTVMSGNSICM